MSLGEAGENPSADVPGPQVTGQRTEQRSYGISIGAAPDAKACSDQKLRIDLKRTVTPKDGRPGARCYLRPLASRMDGVETADDALNRELASPDFVD